MIHGFNYDEQDPNYMLLNEIFDQTFTNGHYCYTSMENLSSTVQ